MTVGIYCPVCGFLLGFNIVVGNHELLLHVQFLTQNVSLHCFTQLLVETFARNHLIFEPIINLLWNLILFPGESAYLEFCLVLLNALSQLREKFFRVIVFFLASLDEYSLEVPDS